MTTEETSPVRVVLRREQETSLIAVMADESFTRYPDMNTAFDGAGHFGISRGFYEAQTRPATEAECAGLLESMRRRGYAVTVVQRVSWKAGA